MERSTRLGSKMEFNHQGSGRAAGKKTAFCFFGRRRARARILRFRPSRPSVCLFPSYPSKQLWFTFSRGIISRPTACIALVWGKKTAELPLSSIRFILSHVAAATTTMAPSRWMLPATLGVVFSLSVFLPSAEAGCCPNACSGHGTCTVDDACVCYSNWQVRGESSE